MKKKLICVMLTLAMTVSLVACGENKGEVNESAETKTGSEVQTVSVTETDLSAQTTSEEKPEVSEILSLADIRKRIICSLI